MKTEFVSDADSNAVRSNTSRNSAADCGRDFSAGSRAQSIASSNCRR